MQKPFPFTGAKNKSYQNNDIEMSRVYDENRLGRDVKRQLRIKRYGIFGRFQSGDELEVFN